MYRKVILTGFFFLLTGGSLLWSQPDTLEVFEGGIHDGSLLIRHYVRPWQEAFSLDLNAGWFHTAKVHELGGVDVMVSASMTVVPQDARTFDLSAVGFDTLKVAGGDPVAPTVAGPTAEGPELYYSEMYNGNSVDVARFRAPAGTGYDHVYTPMLQVGLGLPAGTDIKGRVMIPVDVPRSNSRMSLIGFGIKHDLKQWMQGIEDLPVAVAFFAGYSHMQIYSGFREEPDDYTYMEDYRPAHFSGQEIRTILQGYAFDLILSSDIPYVNVYAAVGYFRSWGRMEVNGRIPVPVFDPDLNPDKAIYTDDHVYRVPDTDLHLDSGVRVSAGLRLNVSLFVLHLGYAWAGNSVYSAGLGISFR